MLKSMDTSTPFHRRVVFFDGFSGGVQFRANVVSEVFQRAPTGNRQDEEGLVVLVFIVRQLGGYLSM
jgi:hypothetical protein